MITDEFSFNEKKDDYAYFRFAFKDSWKILNYISTIQKNLAKSDVATLNLFNELLDSVGSSDAEKKNFYDNLLMSITNSVTEYLKKSKGYNFEQIELTAGLGDIPDENNNPLVSRRKRRITCKLEDMVKVGVSSLIKRKMKNEKLEESDCIIICYIALNKLKNNKLKKKHQKQLTHYKLTVITGCILMQMGLLSKGELGGYSLDRNPPSNAQIKEAIIYFTNKVKNGEIPKSSQFSDE